MVHNYFYLYLSINYFLHKSNDKKYLVLRYSYTELIFILYTKETTERYLKVTNAFVYKLSLW